MKKEERFRHLITQEAARLMVNEGVKQYFDAKRIAARRIIGKQYKYNPKYLPSNGEISEAVHALGQLQDPRTHQEQLFRMRMCALEVMQQLEPFSPRLIGSVSTGRIREGSDIDLHVFTDNIEVLEHHLQTLGWSYQRDTVCIRVGSKLLEYEHIHLDFEFPVELSVYPEREIRVTGRSSTDGKPIQRLTSARVRRLVMDEHWQAYLRAGGLDE
ncbi:nucleotidyltransferase domain-containing protein [Microbulbifer guangxiensis]|uniref:nucleotidyltransferase domain-containing protein n=1 Tax=Microbulbifer guangxiensis TaxID=2904249 RepID=UPI001F36A5C4|nr:nucleotidyltransferase domain-containing protein [Microbulbifer guangxiensis]